MRQKGNLKSRNERKGDDEMGGEDKLGEPAVQRRRKRRRRDEGVDMRGRVQEIQCSQAHVQLCGFKHISGKCCCKSCLH